MTPTKPRSDPHVIYRLMMLIVALVPVTIYGMLVFDNAVNIPFNDDYFTILDYLHEPELLSRINYLPYRNSEHRPAFNRLVAEIVFQVSGKIDFRSLIYVGNLLLLGVLLMLYAVFRRLECPAIYFLPVPFLLFQTQTWENMTWATAALQNNGVLFFVFLSLYLWNNGPKYGRFAGLLSGVTATFTSANGIFIFPLMLVEQLTRFIAGNHGEAVEQRKFFLRWSGFLCATVLLFGVYLRGLIYQTMLIQQIRHPVKILEYFVCFLGAPMQYLSMPVVFSFGILEIVLFIYLTCKRYDLKNPLIYYFLAFLFMTGLATAMGRTGIIGVFTSRYKTASLMIIILEYLSLLDLYRGVLGKRPLWGHVFVWLSAIFFLHSSPYFPEHKEHLIKGMRQWELSEKQGLRARDQEDSARTLREAVRAGYYTPPQ